MIVVNYDHVMWAYVSDREELVTLHFVNGTDMPLFDVDAVTAKNTRTEVVRNRSSWNKAAWEEGE